MIELTVEGVAFDEFNRVAVILINQERTLFLPIWIGPAEAMAIAMELEGKIPPRPMTHDLLKNLIEVVGSWVSLVTINDYRETIFYAQVSIETKDGFAIHVDARPSDAIALALRTGTPIFGSEEVFNNQAHPVVRIELQEEIERFEKLIDGVDFNQPRPGD